jgi:methyl-accepting chemotaxis protein
MAELKSRAFLGNTSVRSKIAAIVGLIVLFMIGISGTGIVQFNKIGIELEGIAERDIPLTEILTKITTHQLEQAIHLERAIRYGEVLTQSASNKEHFSASVESFKHLAEKVNKEI